MVSKVLLAGFFTDNFGSTPWNIEECGVAVGRDTALQARKAMGLILDGVIEIFFDLLFPAAVWPWRIDSTRNIYEYQGYFMRRGRWKRVVRGAGNFANSVGRLSRNPGSLNLLE